MKKILYFAVLGLACVSLLLAGCSPPAGTPAPLVQDPIIALQNTPTAAVQEAAVSTPPPSVFAAVDGLVWDDQDRDGRQDVNEKGVPGVGVTVLTGARIVAATTTTDGNGAYRVTGLVPGDYILSLVPPPGFVFSPQDQGVNELVDSDTDTRTAETLPVALAAGENGLLFTTGIYLPAAAVQAEPGTVKPPPPDLYVCVPGTYSLGGISTVIVNQLAPGYCLRAYLWNHAFAIGRIPGGAGRILSAVTFVEYLYQDGFVYRQDPPGEPDGVQVCYAVPAGMQAQIYFFDHFGPRFGHPHSGQPSWEPLETTIQSGVACAAAQTSGAYALIGK